jgi:hypothetical protein
VRDLYARQRPTAPPEDRVTAAVEALADELEAEQGRHELDGERWQSPIVRRLRAAIAAAREDNGGAGDA